jgi:hypothetical protein
MASRTSTYTVSHLCGNKACINRDHIVVESHTANESRKEYHSNAKPGVVCEHDFVLGSCGPSCMRGMFLRFGNRS